MKNLLIALLIAAQNLWAVRPDCNFAMAPDYVPNRHAHVLADITKDSGLAQTSYMAHWKIKNPNGVGPWANEGNTLVTAVPKNKITEWHNKIGKKSFGLILDGVPETNPGTANLRVRDRYYQYYDIPDGDGPWPLRDLYIYEEGFTEATFIASDKELDAIEAFLKARGAQEIKANRAIPSAGLRKGDPIDPEFNQYKNTYAEESCAGACTSFFNDNWLRHYEAPEKEVLVKMKDRLQLKETHIAKQMIWHNYRNPNISAVTIVSGENPRLLDNFIETNRWHSVRGMTAHGTMPDPGKASNAFDTKRIPVKDWTQYSEQNLR